MESDIRKILEYIERKDFYGILTISLKFEKNGVAINNSLWTVSYILLDLITLT